MAKDNLIFNFITGSFTFFISTGTAFIRNPIFIAIQDVDGFYNQDGQINEFVGILEFDSEYTLGGYNGVFLSYK